MLKFVNIVGARPQFIKYFPVSEAIKKLNSASGKVIEDVLVHTGQHYDYEMSKIFFDEFGIKEPNYHLGVGSGSHGGQTGEIIQKVENVLNTEKPDVVLVYGDTNSTMGAALAAVKIHISVAHIESGLRSYNKYMPEEINRITTDHISTVLFCPSKTAANNLRNEGFRNLLNDGDIVSLDSFKPGKAKFDINASLVINAGDVMYDVLLYSVDIAESRSRILDLLQLNGEDYCVLTLHRAESTDDLEKFEKITRFVSEISSGKTVIFPMHPRTRNVYGKTRSKFGDNIKIIEPVSYFDMLLLMKNSLLVMTDSGGMQKEAYWLKTPCITLREETEWIETIASGWNVLYNDYKGPHETSGNSLHYGDGRAAERIMNILGILKNEECKIAIDS